MDLHEHLRRMEPEMIVKKILTFQENRDTSSVGERGLTEKFRIREENIENRAVFGNQNAEVKNLSEEKPKKTTRVLSEEKQG